MRDGRARAFVDGLRAVAWIADATARRCLPLDRGLLTSVNGVTSGFEAGIRLGASLERETVAVRIRRGCERARRSHRVDETSRSFAAA
jgi:hypothetical protein